MTRRALAALVAMVALLLGTQVAVAAEGSQLGIRPAQAGESWTTLTIAPGGQGVARAAVQNRTAQPQDAYLTAVDAVTTPDGTFTLAQDGAPATGVGAWITLGTTQARIAPGLEQPVDFIVRVPADAEPGDYAGGVVVRADEPAERRDQGGVAINVVERVGLRVYVTVPGVRDGRLVVEGLEAATSGGALPRAALGLPTGLDTRFTVRHAGNVRYEDLTGTVELRRDGELSATAPLDLGTVLPGSSRPVALRVPLPTFSPGDWTVSVRLDGESPMVAQAGLALGATRVWIAGALALGLVGLACALWWRRSGRGAGA